MALSEQKKVCRQAGHLSLGHTRAQHLQLALAGKQSILKCLHLRLEFVARALQQQPLLLMLSLLQALLLLALKGDATLVLLGIDLIFTVMNLRSVHHAHMTCVLPLHSGFFALSGCACCDGLSNAARIKRLQMK